MGAKSCRTMVRRHCRARMCRIIRTPMTVFRRLCRSRPRCTFPCICTWVRLVNPLVKKGDYVKVGQLIGSSEAFMSARTHSSVSGTVEAITTMTTSIGNVDQVVVIATDGKQEVSEEVKPPVVTNYQEFLEALKCSGLVDLAARVSRLTLSLILKTSTRSTHWWSMLPSANHTSPLTCGPCWTNPNTRSRVKGIKAVQQFMPIKHVYIGIEDNKPQAIEKLRKEYANESSIEVVPLKAMYPKGAEKVIAYETAGKVIKEGQLPWQAGVIISNVTSMAFIGEYLTTGMPLITKTITVDALRSRA